MCESPAVDLLLAELVVPHPRTAILQSERLRVDEGRTVIMHCQLLPYRDSSYVRECGEEERQHGRMYQRVRHRAGALLPLPARGAVSVRSLDHAAPMCICSLLNKSTMRVWSFRDHSRGVDCCFPFKLPKSNADISKRIVAAHLHPESGAGALAGAVSGLHAVQVEPGRGQFRVKFRGNGPVRPLPFYKRRRMLQPHFLQLYMCTRYSYS